MRIRAISLFFFSSLAFAQPISFGVRGGVPLTGPFADVTDPLGIRTHSGSTSYIVGPMVELRLPFGFSVEADGLYHPLHLTQQISTSTLLNPGVIFNNESTFQSWEFPILAKYRFLHLPLIKPYVDAGPSFRAVSSVISDFFSKAGATFGAGVELKLLKLRIEPELRYTRWGSDATVYTNVAAGRVAVPNLAQSSVNQVQFLVGLAF